MLNNEDYEKEDGFAIPFTGKYLALVLLECVKLKLLHVHHLDEWGFGIVQKARS